MPTGGPAGGALVGGARVPTGGPEGGALVGGTGVCVALVSIVGGGGTLYSIAAMRQAVYTCRLEHECYMQA